MQTPPYFQFLTPTQKHYDPQPAPRQTEITDDALELLVHQKSQILAKKLDILAAEIWWRLFVANRNLKALDEDRTRLDDLLSQVTRQANYHLRDPQEESILHRKRFDLETEKRSQQVECWRDVTDVMRDFLAVWEAHNQAQARARFLQHVGTGP